MNRFLSTTLIIFFTFGITACQNVVAQLNSSPREIIKSPNDPREYRYLQLDNGIQIALVSSKETTTSAIVVNVHAGSSQEPDEWPGLAHLLEHMLFLGSDKYPGADDFDSFLSEHGGSSNAWTSNTDTLFYLTIPNAHYENALERISRFFIAPKMDPDFLERERHAVDSEFQIYRQQDGRRFHLIDQATGNPKHPANRFSIGNLDTLQDHNGLSLREALLKFHDQWYFGSNISVTIISDASLDEMEQLAQKHFSPVRSVKNPPARPKLPALYSSQEQGVRIDSVSLQQMRNLSLEFYLPPDPDAIYSKPLLYIAHLLGHEAKGSLASTLKKKGWIQDLVAYHEDNTLDAGLTVEMSLTKEGFEHIEDITGQIFAYIQLIKNHGVTREHFDELQQEYDLAFRFLEQGSPENTAIALASGMALYPPEELIQSRFLYRKFSPDKIQKYLTLMTPENLRMRVAQQDEPPVDAEKVKTEPWAGGRYSVQKLSEEQKNKFAASKPDPDLGLPNQNPFMPDDLSLIYEKTAEKPKLLVSEPGFKSWFQHDNRFHVPRGSILLRFAAPHLVNSPENSIRLALFTDLFNRSFAETAYMASLGGLDYSITWDYRGIYLQVLGYNDKLPLFLETVISQMKQLQVQATELDKSKELFEEALSNYPKEDPARQVFRTLRTTLYPLEFEDSKKLQTLDKVSADDLQEWTNKLFNQLSLTAFIHGNIEQSTAATVNSFLSTLVSGPDNNSVTSLPRIIKDKPEFPVCYISYDKDDSALMIFTQSEKRDHKSRAVYRILANILSSPFYTQLRTKEQLGYIVWSEGIEQSHFPGIVFVIQSPNTPPEQLDFRVTTFLKEFEQTVQNLNDEDLATHKGGIIAGLTEPNPNLFSATQDYWADIDGEYPEFDQTKQLVEATKEVTVQEVQALYNRILKQQKQFRIYGYNQNSVPEHAPRPCNAPDFRKQFINRK